MLTRELQHTIDERWDACWPTSKLRPIVILDLVSYLFFVRRTSIELQLNEVVEDKPGIILQIANRKGEVKRDFFSDPENRDIYSLFASENGVAELEKEYSQHAEYGSFFKSSLIMLPTPKLLENALGIIKIIEEADDDKKGLIFEYLLTKAELVDPNGHAYLPEYLVELLVDLTQPCQNDFILDPSTGNGSLLAGCAKYIDRRNLKPFGRNTSDFDSQKLKGMESDVTSLRITAMNLMLHRINRPELKVLDVFSPLNSITGGDATVIIANLIFSPGENNRNVEANTGGNIVRKEIYYLDFILKNLISASRCVVIVPEIILYQAGAEFVTIRQNITENHKLDAVISIDERQSQLFNGAGILVFSKEVASATDKVWFYKLKHNGSAIGPGFDSDNTVGISKWPDDIENFLEYYRNKEKIKEDGEGFFINVDEIKAKNYNFSYNEYCFTAKPKALGVHTIAIKPTDLPKWETKSGNETTSLLQPVTIIQPEKTPFKLSHYFERLKVRLRLAGSLRFINNFHLRMPEMNLSQRTNAIKKFKNISRQKISHITSKVFPGKKIFAEKGIFKLSVLILILAIGCYLFWFLFFQNNAVVKNKEIAETGGISGSVKRSSELNASSLHSIDSVVETTNSDLLKDNISNNKKSYKVISKAHLYSSPALGNPEIAYVTSVDQEILTPIKEDKGFVYVDYVNSRGKNIKGWLNKNDLQASSSSPGNGEINKKVNPDLPKRVDEQATKYVIKTKTYFHLKPDAGSRIGLYLAKPNHTQLAPIREENGFVFVEYSNTKGKVTRGWLNKKDLVKVK